MIKLNNKNITYVALADSANSLKAPKEIWYADSNNSVKLVYRRKDALIEGEDYEKYHWLKAEIPIGVKMMSLPINSDSLYFKRKWVVFGNSSYFVTDGQYAYFTSSNKRIEIYDRGNAVTIYSSSTTINEGDEIVVESTSQQLSIHNITLQKYGYPIIEIPFNNANNAQVVMQSKTTSITVDGVERYIPCKLLKPVPKWLDANGIRRQVGECGMIDLVSGKFYGNVNSVGTFTVENYYERKEWLVGDGSAYIKGIDYNLWANRVELKVGKINVTTIQNNELHYKPTDGDGNVWAVQQNPTITPQFICIFRESGAFAHIVHIDLMPSQVTLSFYQNGGYAYCLYNDTENKGGTLNQSSWDTNIIPTIFSYKMSYIREVLPNGSYRSNLIPCTLTMDLPASMDANGIARTKGTSGMWDLVSDRFYGNVANSGTFKAVNLAEGVDYEVHQWLQEDGSAYIQGIEYDLWNNHLQFQIGKVSNYRSYIDYSNSDYNSMLIVATQSNMLMVIFRQTPDVLHIADINPWTSPDVVTMELYIDNSTFYCVQNGVTKVNSPTQSNATLSAWGSIYPQIRSAKMSYIREVLPDGTYKSNLIPVKLLRSIPSTYDANGIARQAGECGMYDTVNDKFYGNMASSGTFSVSDDN